MKRLFRWTTIVLLLFVLASGAANAQSFGLGGPTETALNRTIDEAHNNWTYQSQKMRSLMAELRTLQVEMRGLEPRIGSLKSEVAALVAEKEPDMDEFRRGERCSACKRTRRQLARELVGETADDHIRANSKDGVPELPTAEEIAAREKDWDDKIAAKQQELNAADKRYGEVKGRASLIANEILNVRRNAWATAIRAEGNLRQRAWEQERAKLEAQVAQMKKSLYNATSAYNQAQARARNDRAALEGLKASRDALRSQLATLQEELPSRFKVHDSAMKAFLKEAETDRQGLMAAAPNRFGDGFNFLLGTVHDTDFAYSFYFSIFGASIFGGSSAATGGGVFGNDAKSDLEGGSGEGKTGVPPKSGGTGSGSSPKNAKEDLEGKP